ncbi:xylulokinase [Tropicibacter naphthalenivorans]|uniref:Xylulose kinase n=1 Tax=Tropicibacter naphthalenivorans TaxID=441103 RepID=A0A0P1FZR2_9RHOB|nr:xylulokinase [Tropicibacter naphthalenivorans]CUH74914.1 Xylulose kinase [Tropicibacter naphthalenivorans]SMC48162.1 xylulokinase [Tropicibacter naphthalenivorans]
MFLGLDLGTSGLRALLVDMAGLPVASEAHAYGVSHPHPGWSEQDPAHWVAAVDTVMTKLAAEHADAMAQVRGIGVSGHMHGATLLDDKGEVLRPCILWNDTRSHEEAALLDGIDGVRQLSGNIVFPGFTAPKLMWVKRNEPEVFAKIAKVLLPAAYMNFFLTAGFFADMSDSAGTSWLDVGQRAWSDTLLAAGEMQASQMPTLVEGSEVGGTLRGELAKRWGMSDSVVVVGGAGDNAAAACGVGAMREGAGFVSLGTSGVLLTGRDGYAPLPESAVHTFCHAVPGQWYQMGVILAATDSLNWLSRVTGAAPADLSRELGDTITGPERLRFLPYLSGERTPHNDSRIRGAFLNIDVAHDRKAMTQAVMEGVAFALRDSAEALKASGAQLDNLLAIGGGAASRFWVQTIATLLDLPLELPQAGDFGAALGAARLAMVGSGAGSVEDIMARPAVAETIEPVAALRGAYDDAYAAYRESYPAVRGL